MVSNVNFIPHTVFTNNIMLNYNIIMSRMHALEGREGDTTTFKPEAGLLQLLYYIESIYTIVITISQVLDW